jgi:hypothetical protein
MTGCKHIYDVAKCTLLSPEEMNYETLIDYHSTRFALHTGNRNYAPFSKIIRWNLNEDLMKSESSKLQFVMENYKVNMVYSFVHN